MMSSLSSFAQHKNINIPKTRKDIPERNTPCVVAVTTQCTLGLTNWDWSVLQNSILVSYIIGVLIKEITLLLEN